MLESVHSSWMPQTYSPQVLLEKSPNSPVEEIELIFAPFEESLFTKAVSSVSEFKVAV